MLRKNFTLIILVLAIVLPVLGFAQTAPNSSYTKTPDGQWFCGPNEVVAYAGWDTKKTRPFCKPTSCFSDEKLCPAADKPFCCPAAWQCGLETVDVNPSWYWGRAKITSFATCLPPDPPRDPTTKEPLKPNDYIACGPTSGDKKMAYCAKSTQECVEIWLGYAKAKHCQPKGPQACGPDEKFVQGTGDYANEKRCCPKGTTPSVHGAGMPFCARPLQSASILNGAYCNSLNFYNWLSLFYPGDGSSASTAAGRVSSSCSQFSGGATSIIGSGNNLDLSDDDNAPATPSDSNPPPVTAGNPIRPDFNLYWGDDTNQTALTVAVGETAWLHWNVAGVSNCQASSHPASNWAGTKPSSGSFGFPATGIGAYTLTLACGGTTKTLALTVKPLAPVAAPVINLYWGDNPAQTALTIQAGETAWAHWTTSNTSLCSGRGAWNNPLVTPANAGSANFSPVVLGTHIYTLVCSNAAGSVEKSVMLTVTAPTTVAQAPISVILPRGGEVWRIGETREINWSDPNHQPASGIQYYVYASTRDGSWYGEISHTNALSLNWQVGRVTVDGRVRALSPGNYWIQVIKRDGQVLPNGQAQTQALSAGSVELLKAVSRLQPQEWLASVWQLISDRWGRR